MKFIGLTGRIGSGKSSVGALLRRRGAEIIDVDGLSRDVQKPGQPLFDQIVARWGDGLLDADGGLDRAALGHVVFADPEQLQELTLMVAPITEAELLARVGAWVGTDTVVVVESALFLGRQYGMGGLVLVDASDAVILDRLTNDRGMHPDDARARLLSQIPREDRLAQADHVIDNDGDRDSLEAAVADAWTWMLASPDAVPVRSS